jgi:pyroglutamyl-peptidase
MAKRTILLTGFEPFDGSDDNPSARVVERLASAPIPGVRLVTAVLPVAVGRAPQILLGLLNAHRPAAVLMLGEMRGSPCVRVERIAVNMLHASIPDNDGVVLDEEPIDPAGPAAYWATLPAQATCDAVRRAGVPCVCSFSAGAYLCNQVMYLALHWSATQSPKTKVGFLHLPSLPSQMHAVESPKPTMNLAGSVKAVRAALAALATS